MPNATGRELVGVVVIDLIETAEVMTIDVYRQLNFCLKYKVRPSRFYTLRFAVAFLRHAHKENLVGFWHHPRLAAYYLQLSPVWRPEAATGHQGWQAHDGQAIT